MKKAKYAAKTKISSLTMGSAIAKEKKVSRHSLSDSKSIGAMRRQSADKGRKRQKEIPMNLRACFKDGKIHLSLVVRFEESACQCIS